MEFSGGFNRAKLRRNAVLQIHCIFFQFASVCSVLNSCTLVCPVGSIIACKSVYLCNVQMYTFHLMCILPCIWCARCAASLQECTNGVHDMHCILLSQRIFVVVPIAFMAWVHHCKN